ncbi:MAG: CAP domain-containing protein [Candidatus Bathyarchaeota archaeon]|nr:CAP domain-containing protein [Candidatus Bathyarchaeota archaeon]
MKTASRKHAAAIALVALALAANLFLLATASAQSPETIQTDFLGLVNVERVSLGLSPLTANPQLEAAAYLHSKDMGDNNYFSHTSMDGTQFSQRITNAGYKWVAAAENIAMAYGVPSAAKVYDMWKNSPGHYANMIGNYLDAGLGVYSINGYTYYTLDLGRSQPPSPTQTPKPSSSPTPTPQPTAAPTPTQTPTPTPPSPTPKPPTPTPTPTTSTPDPTANPTPTHTPTPTPPPPTPKPTLSSTAPTFTASPTPTSAPTETSTNHLPTPSATPTPSPTNLTSAPPTSTPAIPELPGLALVAMTLLALIVAVSIKTKNRESGSHQ